MSLDNITQKIDLEKGLSGLIDLGKKYFLDKIFGSVTDLLDLFSSFKKLFLKEDAAIQVDATIKESKQKIEQGIDTLGESAKDIALRAARAQGLIRPAEGNTPEVPQVPNQKSAQTSTARAAE